MGREPYSDDPITTLPDVGCRLRALRKAAGLTQAELAKASGVRQEDLSRLETGAAESLQVSRLLSVLQALGHRIEFRPAMAAPTLDRVLEELRLGRNSGPHAR
jgi:HTH-type transcriptional regulator/antitoxin HipB